jgi:hypothetical protein
VVHFEALYFDLSCCTFSDRRQIDGNVACRGISTVS